MAEKENPEDHQPRQKDRILFIHSNSGQPISSGSIFSHARRWQTSQRRQELRTSAKQAAGYARSLVGWRSRDSNSSAQTGVQQTDTSRNAPLMTVQPTGGLRVDPFDALPVEHNRDLMFVTDYFIHVWVFLKATQFDNFIGYNTYLTVCWPAALQDAMLFDATLAVSKSAWCLSQQTKPLDDQFVLRHRGAAISKLRQRLSEGPQAVNESILFTMDYMINVAYMTNDYPAFDIHLSAFRRITDGYTFSNFAEAIRGMISHRLRSWEALDEYRKGVDPVRQTLRSRQHGYPHQPTYFYGSPSWHQTRMLAKAAPGFVELVHSGSICFELAEASVKVGQLLSSLSTHSSGPVTTGHIMDLLTEILLLEPLSELESCINYTLLALCFYGKHGLEATSRSAITSSEIHLLGGDIQDDDGRKRVIDQLDVIAKAYLNKRIDSHLLPQLNRPSMNWCSLVLGSIALSFDHEAESEHRNDFVPQRLKGKGHIILLTAAPQVVQIQDATWDVLQADGYFDQFLGTPDLFALMRRCWEATIERQRRWEENGWLQVGAPMTDAQNHGSRSVDVEYMVLREARDSLPKIEAEITA